MYGPSVPELDVLLALGVIVLAGSFLQGLTGFGLGMTIVGLVSAFAVAPVSFTADLVNFVALPHGMMVLWPRRQEVDWRLVATFLLGIGPGLALGLYLLRQLEGRGILEIVLGAAVCSAALVFAFRPTPRSTRTPLPASVTVGLLSGTLGGLFSVAGPPVVFYLYLQKMEVTRIRSTLVATFVTVGTLRAAALGATGYLTGPVLGTAALMAPLAILSAALAAPLTEKIPAAALRRVVFVLLVVLGLTVIGRGVGRL